MRYEISVFVVILSCVLAWPGRAGAQEDSPSLGDVARNLRQKKAEQQAQQQQIPSPPEAPRTVRTVIDNDNLAEVMEDVKKARPAVENKAVLSIDPSGNRLKLMSPDATCSLSFNARASSLLVKPVLIEDLPVDQLVKIDGPGSIQDNNLQLEVFNGSNWELREITIGLTLERKPGDNAEMAAQARILPASENGEAPAIERRSNVTLLYHLKTETKAFTKADFRENIGITPGPDEDWRWSIVEAKGIRPAGARVGPESLSEPLFGSATALVPATNEQPGNTFASGSAAIPPATAAQTQTKSPKDKTADERVQQSAPRQH